MRKIALLILLSLFLTSISTAQTSSLKGTVTDSVEKKNRENTVIALLNQSDSTLVAFTRSKADGSFMLNALPAGKYILMATHPYLGDYFDTLQLKKNEQKNIGAVFMTPKIKLLADVILRTGTPIRIKGDTTIYTADSFKVRAGANVEELLRRLPGIQVDKDGNITAMGERVKKVLVDGEEFFGTDPGIATKNLRADAVKEVQVFDKKSDQAEFTGIDDGVRDKTINLKMKKLSGYFGKAELSGGLKNRYNNSLMLNAFKNSRKIAGYFIMSNTGQTNLDWNDRINYGGGLNMNSEVDAGGGVSIYINNDGEDYYGGRNGIPVNWNGGLHYSDKFGHDNKQKFNSGYKFSKINSAGTTTNYSRTFLGENPDSVLKSNNNSQNAMSNVKHAANLTLEFQIDSSNTLKWTSQLNKKNTFRNVDFYSETFAANNDSLNTSNQNSHNNSDNSAVNSTLLWLHKFKKLFRTLSINTKFNWSQSKSDGTLYSLNKYYNQNTLHKMDTIDQNNFINSTNKIISTKIAYTEPLAKDFYMELSHAIDWNSNSNDRETFSKDGNGKYTILTDSLSNSFVFDRLVNTPGINFKMNKRKYSYSFGAAVGFSRFTQKNITTQVNTKYNYTNFFPQVVFNYKIKPSKNLRFRYNGSTNAPSLQQLQPITVNTDPLNIYIGNPGLVQSFNHSFSTSYDSYNILKQRSINFRSWLSFTQNDFVQANTVDSVGKRIYQTINVNGNYYFNLNAGYSFKIKNNFRMSLDPNFSKSRRIDFINNQKNTTINTSYRLYLNFSSYKKDKYNLYISPNIGWIHSEATVNNAANADYWELGGYCGLDYNISKKLIIHTNLNTELRQKDPRFPQNNNSTKWNMDLTKYFFKDNSLEAKFGVYDLLNQNRGYDRNFTGYNFTESYYTTLKRYWMLTLTWNIAKNGKPAGF